MCNQFLLYNKGENGKLNKWQFLDSLGKNFIISFFTLSECSIRIFEFLSKLAISSFLVSISLFGFLHLFTKHKLKRCQPLPFKYNLLSNNKNLFNYISKLYKRNFFKNILKKKFTPKTIQDHNLICGHKNLKHLK